MSVCPVGSSCRNYRTLWGRYFSGQGQGQVEFQGQEEAGGGQEREGEEVEAQKHIMG